MARKRASRSRIARMSIGDVLDKARAAGFQDSYIEFLDVTLRQFAGDFAESTREMARRKGAEDTGRLIGSIHGRSIVFKEGDAKAGIAMELYGFFVNAGVGRGVTVTERQTGVALTSSRTGGGGVRRTPKPFIDESLLQNSTRLADLLGREGADFISSLISESMKQSIRMEV